MAHLPHLITDLALILGAAAVVTLIFKKLKQPLVLGYIISGFLVSPHFTLTPNIVDTENVETLAEIGVIFLLFSLGLEFSFKKLLRVGGSAFVTALVEIICVATAGYFLGIFMGWSDMDSLFLGGMLASSSTTIILRAFDELGVKTKKFAGVVFGVLIVEDIVVILLMVLLSTMSITRTFEGTQMLFTILKLVFFLILWFIAGIFLLPTILKRGKKLFNEETLLILSLSLCLGMVVLATAAGFSAELGAFVMGSIIAETTSAEKIEHLLKPIKDLFGAIFFTSVGMMIDPSAMVEYAQPIFWVTLLTLFGKFFSTTIGALLSGQPLRQSVQVGMSMAQIGEFAFIVAALGLSLGVTSAFLFPVAVGASAITTFTTPYLIKSSGHLAQWLNRVLPEPLLKRIASYSSETKNVAQLSEWRQIIRSTLVNVAILSIIILAIIVFSARYIEPWILENGNSLALRIAACLLNLVVLSPFLWALAVRTPAGVDRLVDTQKKHAGIFYVVRAIRFTLGAFFIGALLLQYFSLVPGLAFTAFIVVLLVMFSEKMQYSYAKIENLFFTNLNERETELSRLNRTELAPWDAHIVPVVIPSVSATAGRRLEELRWRENIGVNVVMIKRGDINIPTPGKEHMIFPGDTLLVLGTDIQVQRLKVLIRAEQDLPVSEIAEVELASLDVADNSVLTGKTIRQSGLRDKANALVVGIQRGDERILNPESDTLISSGDILFIVANQKTLRDYLSSLQQR